MAKSNAEKAASAATQRPGGTDNAATQKLSGTPAEQKAKAAELNGQGDAPPWAEERPGAQPADEHVLSTEEIVQRRTPGGDRWPADGRFRWVFHVERPRTSQPKNAGAADDWADEDGSMASMHAANKVATLQFALGNGCHPTGEAELDQVIGAEDEDAAVVDLVYAVPVVPASLQAPEEAPLTYTPSAALGDLGGTTLAERTTAPEGHLAKGTTDTVGSKEMAADRDGQHAEK